MINNNYDELLTGFNIAGDERQNSFSKMAELTSQSPLKKTFHAEEICSPVSITQALDAGTTRIGHGIATIDNE
ncbi:amidohydrolase family protein [Citrobacter portucalensis]|uniref:hypothetical protein n=1 Tax=Citrobacter portucalensis TaxID=1639133 RepID=UPI002B4754E9|nr:hypothetical protein [Citrobacter portucalensis]